MSTPARRRLLHDFKKLQEDPPASGTFPIIAQTILGVTAAPNEDNVMQWQAVIFGYIHVSLTSF